MFRVARLRWITPRDLGSTSSIRHTTWRAFRRFVSLTNRLLHLTYRLDASNFRLSSRPAPFFTLLHFLSGDFFRYKGLPIPPPRCHKLEDRDSGSSQRTYLVPRMQHKRHARNDDNDTELWQCSKVAIVDKHLIWRLTWAVLCRMASRVISSMSSARQPEVTHCAVLRVPWTTMSVTSS